LVDPNVEPLTVWKADEARSAALSAATQHNQIFQLDEDGRWSAMAQ
jgi:hypothetical protein